MKSYNFKYSLDTRAKLRELQEYLEKKNNNEKATINDTLEFCICQAFNNLKKDESFINCVPDK